ncbi:hypothetical protein IAQ61_002165 [Plenodomus lingam]|uniref:uncharacterized protein n=1 Tax=Leptosphaeria maculans TaxID=5022 RepID=UPI003321F14C|nr:hypothetical protein IAQ61_002165 [Plenodomus lingam]
MTTADTCNHCQVSQTSRLDIIHLITGIGGDVAVRNQFLLNTIAYVPSTLATPSTGSFFCGDGPFSRTCQLSFGASTPFYCITTADDSMHHLPDSSPSPSMNHLSIGLTCRLLSSETPLRHHLPPSIIPAERPSTCAITLPIPHDEAHVLYSPSWTGDPNCTSNDRTVGLP